MESSSGPLGLCPYGTSRGVAKAQSIRKEWISPTVSVAARRMFESGCMREEHTSGHRPQLP